MGCGREACVDRRCFLLHEETARRQPLPSRDQFVHWVSRSPPCPPAPTSHSLSSISTARRTKSLGQTAHRGCCPLHEETARRRPLPSRAHIVHWASRSPPCPPVPKSHSLLSISTARQMTREQVGFLREETARRRSLPSRAYTWASGFPPASLSAPRSHSLSSISTAHHLKRSCLALREETARRRRLPSRR